MGEDEKKKEQQHANRVKEELKESEVEAAVSSEISDESELEEGAWLNIGCCS